MGLLQEFKSSFIHWSIGITVLTCLTSTQFSGIGTITALPIVATSITLSALCGSSLNSTDANYRKRKFCDILDFFKIWIEILEILSASAICARMASATIDYISNGRFREWFLGLQSHTLGEPWPDLIGVTIIVVITALFMFGLEKSPSFSILLFLGLLTMFTFFIFMGTYHTIISLPEWFSEFKKQSFQSVITAAAMCSYSFVNTLPKFTNYRKLKITTIIFVPLFLYITTVFILTLMTHYKELEGTATPLLRVFELRDVDFARLVMAICIISVVCLTLTEILPSLYNSFLVLSSLQWQVFLTSLQYRNSFTGAPILTIFAAGSLAAILAFACPLTYLIKLVNTSVLLKCIIIPINVIYNRYKPEFNNETYFSAGISSKYSKLKPIKKDKSRFLNQIWNNKPNNRNKNNPGPSEDNEYLLLNDYCGKSANVGLIDESSDESDGKESVLSLSDMDDSCSSTDIDAIVEEYKERIKVATIDNFSENRQPSITTTVTVIIFVFIIILVTISLTQVILYKYYFLSWPCLAILILSTIVILLMPTNSILSPNEILVRCLTPFCAILAIILNVILTVVIIGDVWPGFVFWLSAGSLLFWRCECCTCDGLFTQNRKIAAKDLSQYPEYVDTILIAR